MEQRAPGMPIKVAKGGGWASYLIIVGAGMSSMFLGASMVHHFYKPDLRIPAAPPAARGPAK